MVPLISQDNANTRAHNTKQRLVIDAVVFRVVIAQLDVTMRILRTDVVVIRTTV